MAGKKKVEELTPVEEVAAISSSEGVSEEIPTEESEESQPEQVIEVVSEEAPVAPKEVFTTLVIKAPVDVLVAPNRLEPQAKFIKTKQSIEIPVGGAALFTLADRMLKSPIRLVTTFVLNQTAKPLKQSVELAIDNIGLDGFFLRKGDVIATCVVVSPK
ncbi:hypothetical protein SPFL3102_03556 [Sporomusaceae bacterium FL31]|nr:hypothetical protein SPFL3101_00449 [Sporomusaceae bacterium FL31]GCE35705.1 hypothetical protein SPFL3102_03556 [Sporomusaceae bacterium]